MHSLQAKLTSFSTNIFVSFKVIMTQFRLDSMIARCAQFLGSFSIGIMKKQAINFPRMTLEIP